MAVPVGAQKRRPPCCQILLADRGYDSDALTARLAKQGAWGNIKPMPIE